MSVDLTRISRKYVEIDVTATLANGDPDSIAGVDLALLPVGAGPDASTVWTAATYAGGTAAILMAGPDAGGSGALVAESEMELWGKVTDAPEVDAAPITRVNVKNGTPAVQSIATVTDAYVTGLVTGATGTRTALDARYAPLNDTTAKPHFGGLTLGSTSPDTRIPVKSSIGINPGQAGTSDHVAHLFQTIASGPWTETTGADPNFVWGTNFFTLFSGGNDGLVQGYGGLLEADVADPVGNHLGTITGLQAEAAFYGASSGATVDAMRSLRVAAPSRKAGATAGTATTAIGLSVGAVTAAAVGATTAYSMLVDGGISRLQGPTQIGLQGAAEVGLTIQTYASPTADFARFLDVFSNLKGHITNIGLLAMAHRVLAFEGQAAQVTIGDQGPSSEAGISFGISADTKLWRASDGTLRFKNGAATATAVQTAGQRQELIPGLQTPKATAGSWNYQQQGASYLGGYITNNGSSVQNDAVTFYDVWLGPGTWQCDLLGYSGTDGAILTASLAGPDGTLTFGTTQDQYAASPAALRNNLGSVTVTTPGLCTLILNAGSKNASSSSYRARAAGAILTRSA